MIPACDVDGWILPEGIHQATRDELYERFVLEAPYSAEREVIFIAFVQWATSIKGYLPDAKFWVNGGFSTHKPWAAPRDIDVVVFSASDPARHLSDFEQELLISLFTSRDKKVKPMQGLVDAFFCPQVNVDKTLYWRETWATALDINRTPLQTRRKGFLEVTL